MRTGRRQSGRVDSIRPDWTEEIDDAVRGLASGFLVGIPVVFTVDSWWLGDQSGPMDSLVLIGFSYLLTLAAIYWIGFHRGQRRGWEYFADALEAVALAILALVAVFWSLGQIGDGQAPSIALGRIAVAAAPVSLGVAVANHLLPRDASRFDPDRGDATSLRDGHRWNGWRRTLFELAASLAGALFICLSIVPVDDLSAISTEVPARNLPVVIILSLVVTYSVVFAAGFAGERQRHATRGPLQHPLAETVIAYLAAVAVSLVVLWIFGRIDAESAPFQTYTMTILLAFPASMAAAAGRLAV
jgi:putative integral membrane protein (TIGR02587 family)